MALADNIMANARRRIAEIGLRDQDVARRVGVTPQVMSRWLNRKADPSLENVDKLAKALEMTVEDLARDPEESVIPLPGRDVDSILKDLATVRGYDLVKRKKP
jgi:transcriptional regulator with XRE-family HTH domain